MEIIKFDLKTGDIETVSELIIRGYSESGQNISTDQDANKIVREFIETGNNFIGHENIYLCIVDNQIAGLVIGYKGKSYSRLKTLIDLLSQFKLTQILNYIIISSQLFDSAYTPYLEEDDFYVSVIVVGEEYRNRGIGSFLLRETKLIAKEKGCKKIVLEVDRDNENAIKLYNKLGFKFMRIKNQNSKNTDNNNYTMEYNLI